MMYLAIGAFLAFTPVYLHVMGHCLRSPVYMYKCWSDIGAHIFIFLSVGTSLTFNLLYI